MHCTYCGAGLKAGARFCTGCGKPTGPHEKTVGQIEHDMRHVLPMGTPISAVAAGYLGLFSVLVIPAPFALVMGIVGLKQIKKSDKPYGRVRCWVGILLGGLFTALLLFVVVMAVIA